MSIEDNIFSEEYTCDLEKTELGTKCSTQEKSSDTEIDSNYYKISKPIRKIIRGKITND